jgi:hypothetical protein
LIVASHDGKSGESTTLLSRLAMDLLIRLGAWRTLCLLSRFNGQIITENPQTLNYESSVESLLETRPIVDVLQDLSLLAGSVVGWPQLPTVFSDALTAAIDMKLGPGAGANASEPWLACHVNMLRALPGWISRVTPTYIPLLDRYSAGQMLAADAVAARCHASIFASESGDQLGVPFSMCDTIFFLWFAQFRSFFSI